MNQTRTIGVLFSGGNGSLAGAACLAAESRMQLIGIPCTIDNDVRATDMALGVDTAVNTIVWAVERFNDTASSHHRIMVLEVMGRDSGELARLAALAAGAEIVVTPERGPLTSDKIGRIAARLEKSMISGRRHGIVLVSEGVPAEGGSQERATMLLAPALERHFQRADGPLRETEVRVSVLGHLQRGGRPTTAYRILAARFADAAWRVIADGSGKSCVLGLKRDRIAVQPLSGNHSDCQRAEFIDQQDIYEIAKRVSRLM
jgi:6-phosphofructokinase 1